MMNTRDRQQADEARAALDSIETQTIGTREDRRIFARGTMLSGLLLGAYVGLLTATAGDGTPRTLGILGSAVLYGLLLVWQNTKGVTIPLGARSTARWGTVSSVVVAFVGIMVVNALANTGGTAGHQTPGALLSTILGLAVAAPIVIAGQRIASGEPR